MSPVYACRHGGDRRRCPLCRRERPPRRAYSDTKAYRDMLVRVRETYGDECHYGDGLVYFGAGAVDPGELAHVVDHADGGLFELENLRVAHRSCNRRAAAQRTTSRRRA